MDPAPGHGLVIMERHRYRRPAKTLLVAAEEM